MKLLGWNQGLMIVCVCVCVGGGEVSIITQGQTMGLELMIS